MRGVALVVLVGCGRIAFDPTDRDGGGATPRDSDGDGVTACTNVSPFGNITQITSAGASTIYDDWQPALHRDGLLLVFESNRPAGSALYAVRRPTPNDPFGPARELTELYGSGMQDGGVGPMWSLDGSRLYYVRYVAIGSGAVVAPYLGGDSFGSPSVVDLPYPDNEWAITSDELELFYTDKTNTPTRLAHATRADLTAPWVPDSELDAFNDATLEVGFPTWNEGRQELFYEAALPAGAEVRVIRRSGRGAAWSAAMQVSELGTDVGDPEISVDGMTIVFASDRFGTAGANDLWYATRTCL